MTWILVQHAAGEDFRQHGLALHVLAATRDRNGIDREVRCFGCGKLFDELVEQTIENRLPTIHVDIGEMDDRTFAGHSIDPIFDAQCTAEKLHELGKQAVPRLARHSNNHRTDVVGLRELRHAGDERAEFTRVVYG